MPRVDNVHEVITQVCKVRQVRQYKPDPVPPELVDQLLEVARWTGSARNSQPWHFIVVDDKQKLKEISQVRTPINWVADAPLAIAIVLEGRNPTREPYDEGRVTERLLIAAQFFGLGGGVAWYGDETLQERGKEILGIPKQYVTNSVVAIGYPKSVKDPRPNANIPGRKPLQEIVSRNEHGQPR